MTELPASIRAISLNDHIVEPSRLWCDRFPRAVRDLAPTVVGDGVGPDVWQIGSRTLPLPSLAVMRYDEVPGQRIAATHAAEIHPALQDPKARLAALDVDGVYAHTLFPHVVGFSAENLLWIADHEARKLAFTAYNDFMVEEFCAENPDRLLAVGTVPYYDPELAAAEIARVADLGARAISLPHSPEELGLPSYFEPSWSRVFGAAADADLPVLIHVGWMGRPPVIPEDERQPNRFLAYLTEVNFDVMRAMIHLVAAGTFVEHPALRVVFVEGGVAWLPYLFDRLDRFWEHRHEFRNVRQPGVRPSDVRDRVFGTMIDDGAGLANRHQIGVGQILWQSDFPHSDSHWPATPTFLKNFMEDLDPTEIRAILHDNPRRLLGIRD